MRTALLYFHTIIHLRPKQIYYQIFYRIRTKLRQIFGFNYLLFIKAQSYSIQLKPSIPSNQSYFSEQNRFKFLNQSQTFLIHQINWNDEKTYGKLWAYNLNYFDFLNQENITKEDGLALIHTYIQEAQKLKTGFEPYPMSLRGINWIKFLSKYQIQDSRIDAFLMAQYVRLVDNLEYRLMANHLLENAFSLLIGAYYFKYDHFLDLATKIFQKELPEQILADGGHFERSPMYHQIMLYKILDCLNLIQNNKVFEEDSLRNTLENYAQKMLNFLQNVTFRNGDIPLVNDAAKNIAPITKQLLEYANQLNIRPQKNILSESGYRKFENKAVELFIDAGNIAPDYQLAHAHCDTLSFILYVHEKPFIVDMGTSTYENNEIRQSERSTAAHNTVQIGDFEQSEMWSSFRVGRRAKAKIWSENREGIVASHNGYEHLGLTHKRMFVLGNQQIIIQDEILGKTKYSQKAYLHFHPDVEVKVIKNRIDTRLANITFEGLVELKESNYFFCEEFNERKSAIMLTLLFKEKLTTKISYRQPP
jgi:Heparinase II/III-like protein/Heparinase II/III N-terminus